MTTHVNWERLKPSPEIELLGQLGSADEIAGELGKYASAFGKINGIMPLPQMPGQGADHWGFLVCFDKTLDAMAASRSWHCLLFGFTSVIVAIRRHADLHASPENGAGTAIN